jgi:hypothetical protein
VEIYFLAMVFGITAYVTCSLLSRQPSFNLDQMLHRGVFAVASDTIAKQEKFRWSIRHIFNRIIGITPEYTRGDKIIARSVLIYSLGYQFLICFLGSSIWNAFSPISNRGWTYYFFVNSLLVPCTIGVISTVWFVAGGVIDIRRLFRDLAARPSNVNDDGWVEGHVSLVDKKAAEDEIE